jgi:citrate lyase subunit alpha/citrate CoA-transferase
VVAVTDELVPYPCEAIEITQDLVDHVVVVESVGDPASILSGTTRPTTDPVGLPIASDAAAVIDASGLLVDGFSFQTYVGGISLAVAAQLAQAMQIPKVCGSVAAGGITGQPAEMLEQGLYRTLFDVQCFDLRAVRSYREERRHAAMSASLYANPSNRGAVVNRLDAMTPGAVEVDLDFNVNVTSGSDGRILGGSGGHSDTAAGAKLAILTTQLRSRKGPKLVEKVRCITTPGETIDVVVTGAGVAVNPQREDLAERLKAAGLAVRSIAELQHLAASTTDGADEPGRKSADGEVVALIQYRDGTIFDVPRKVV